MFCELSMSFLEKTCHRIAHCGSSSTVHTDILYFAMLIEFRRNQILDKKKRKRLRNWLIVAAGAAIALFVGSRLLAQKPLTYESIVA